MADVIESILAMSGVFIKKSNFQSSQPDFSPLTKASKYNGHDTVELLCSQFEQKAIAQRYTGLVPFCRFPDGFLAEGLLLLLLLLLCLGVCTLMNSYFVIGFFLISSRSSGWLSSYFC